MDTQDIRTARDVGIKVTGLSKTFGNTLKALDRVNTETHRGTLTAILGPSGCGKTTLLRIVCGLEDPTEGSVSIGGDTPASVRLAGRIGMAFQEPALLPWRTVTENILLSLDLRKTKVNRSLEDWVTLFKLAGTEGLYPSQLSGGMAQRVSVARALASRPEVLLLDEPFGALDWFLRQQVIRDFEIAWLSSLPSTILVTHDTREAVFLADKVEIMSRRPGRIMGTLVIDLPRPRPKDIFSDPAYRALCDEADRLCARSYE
jgi:NitT/TauT family transport system ATP-binding protein